MVPKKKAKASSRPISNKPNAGQEKFKTIDVKSLHKKRPSVALKKDIQPTIVTSDQITKAQVRDIRARKITVPEVPRLENRDQFWSRQSRPKSRPKTSSQFQQVQAVIQAQAKRDASKESLRDLNEISPPKKVQGSNDEMRLTAIRFYQGNMDDRLSQPKRVNNRFIGFNEDSLGTIDFAPYDNMKRVMTMTNNKSGSISTAADINNLTQS